MEPLCGLVPPPGWLLAVPAGSSSIWGVSFIVLAILALPGAVAMAWFLTKFFRWPAEFLQKFFRRRPKAAEATAGAPEQEPDDVESRQQRFTMMLLLAGFLLLLAYVVGWSEQPFLQNRHDSLVREYLGEVLLALALAALVSFTFSRILDLPEVSRTMVQKLTGILNSPDHSKRLQKIFGDLIYDKSYLQNLASSRLLELRQWIDEKLYGGEGRMGKESLYHFVTNQLPTLYSLPYRRDLLVQIDCTVDDKREWLIWDETTSFVHVRNGGPQPKGREVSFHVHDQYMPSWLEELKSENASKLLRRTIIDARLQVGVTHRGFLTYRFDEAEMQLTLDQDASSLDYANPDPAIPIVPKIVDRDLRWGCSMEFGFADELKDEPEVKVELMMRRKKPLRDDMYHLDLKLPTRGVTLVAHFPDEIQLEIASFQLLGYRDPSINDARPKHGHAFERIAHWALPGHGMRLSWYRFDALRTSTAGTDTTPAQPVEGETRIPDVTGTSR